MADDKLTTPFSLTGKRVWVAGHRGMVGSALVREAATRGGYQPITATRGRAQPWKSWPVDRADFRGRWLEA